MNGYILKKGRASLSDLIDGNGASGYPGAGYLGRDYYVNNITGASGNDGSSWDSAMDQVTTAITASELYRLAQATNNTFVRNRIIVQGTATLYSALTALPNWTDVIGIGADPRGNGSGICRIGATSATDGATGSGGSTDMRGTNWYNIQFNTGGNYYAFHAPVAYRCRWENCTFGTADVGAACYGGLFIVSGSGVVIKNCSTITHSTGYCVDGLKIGADGGTSSGNFNQCLVEDSMFYGSTDGILNNAYLCNQTVFRNNTVYGTTYGIRDTSTETTIGGNAFYVGNYAGGTTAGISIANTGNAAYQCLGNFTCDAGENHIFSVPVVTTST